MPGVDSPVSKVLVSLASTSAQASSASRPRWAWRSWPSTGASGRVGDPGPTGPTVFRAPRASLFLVGYFPGHLFFSGAMWHKRCWTLCFLRQDQFSGKPKLRHLFGQLHSGSEESKEGSTSFWGSPIVKSLWKYRRKNSRKPRRGSPAHFCQGKQGLTCASFHSTLVSLPV